MSHCCQGTCLASVQRNSGVQAERSPESGLHLKHSKVFPTGLQNPSFLTAASLKPLTSQTSLSPQCSINDGAEFKAVADAMKVIGFKQEEIQTVYRIVAAILHLVRPCLQLPAGFWAGGVVFSRCSSSRKICWLEECV